MSSFFSFNIFIALNFFLSFFLLTFISCAKKEKNSIIKVGKVLSRWSGAKLLGSISSGAETVGRSVIVDTFGNVYFAGISTGELDGQSILGTSDAFVSKFNSVGVKQWTRMLGDTGAYTEARGIALDSSNNVYIAGFTSGDLDDKTLTGLNDLFITKFSPSGVKQWTQLLGVASRSAYANGITIDDSDNIYVTGHTDGNLDGVGLSGSNDMFITKYNSSGVKQWTRLLGPAATFSTYAYSISSDSDSNLYVTGYANANLDGKVKTGPIDLFLTKYNSAGTKQWTELLGVAGAFTIGRGVSVDSSNNVYVCGETNGNLDNEGNSTGAWYSLITKYNSAGVKQWTRLLGASSTETYCRGVSVGQTDNLHITGMTNGTLDGNSRTGNTDLFLTQYDFSGVKLWTKQMGVDNSITEAYGIGLNSSGDAFVSGRTNGPVDGKSLSGTYDSFIIKFNSSGIKQ
jgi:hypothetical protein